MENAMSFQERERARDLGDARLAMEREQFASSSGANPRRAMWSALAVFAIVAALFVVFYGLSSERTQTANPPAVTASPAPASGVPAPAPETTTGQGAPRQDTAPGNQDAR